ncbi:condensin complex subunit 3-like [Littorina saxatilis]|uniref:UVR domain-containing protein n=1 Tax=Littorina saxatilis TaxID=31220 RepID=A0AAN9GK82_9CAEN
MTQTMTIKDVLLQCQAGMQCHTKLIKVLKKIFKTMGVEAFWAEFEQLIKFPMVVYNREPTVERTIDFIAKFVTSLSSAPAAEASDQESESEANPLMQRLFDFLLQHHNAKDRAVRFRACQLVTKLLGNLGEEATIDDALYERVFHCMLERLRDKAAVVRVHAVLALVRLQDPTDDTCPVIKAYIFLMTSDPNPEVRKTIVSHIAPCRKTLAAILERTRDVKDTVRQAAFNIIGEKVPMKAMSIGQRVQLLEQGLNDRTESVKSVCGSKLLQSWLRGFEGNVLDLLHSLDVENSTDVCRHMLKHLFGDSPIADLIANFNLLDGSCLVSPDKLTCESAMYWQELCHHVHKAGTDFEEHLDMVLPACLPFCSYLDSVVTQLEGCQDLDKQLELEFIVQQLLNIFTCMDLTDQACRKAVEKLLHKMLLSQAVSYSLVAHLLPCLRSLHSSTDSLVNYLAEVVAEIREPITTVEKGVSSEERRKIDLKIAKVRVELNQAREEMEECVKNQEFQRAAQLKESLHSLEMERSSLLTSAEPTVEEVKTEKNDPATMVKCLTIICEMLETLPLKALTPTLQMLVETQILPGITNQEAAVRNLAVKAVGMCCQLKRDIIKFHLPVLMQASQVDVECVRVTSVKSLFDLIHVYGLGAFEDSSEAQTGATDDTKDNNDDENDNSRDLLENSQESETSATEGEGEGGEGEHSESGWSKAASNLITILSSTLDSESGELRSVVAEGLAKLLMSGRVFSAGLLSRLLLLWYNPLAEEDALLRHTLGTFFPIFAFTDSANQQLFEEAFMPTLRTILNAPTTSPINSVNPSNVADFLVELTHAQRLVSSQADNTVVRENPCHDSIAVKVCNEILSNPQSFQLRLWTRILNQLYLSQDNHTHLKDLSVLCTQMMEVVKEKTSVKAIEKFQKTVTELLAPLSAAELTSLEVTATGEGNMTTAGDGSQAEQGAEATDVGTVSTPSMPPPKGPVTTAKSTGRRVRSKRLNSQLDNSVWSTPSQQEALDRTMPDNLENVRSNLDSLLLDSSKTAGSMTPRTPGSKRALHTIQDPALL